MIAFTKGEGVVTAPWRVEADHAAAARLGCRPTPFRPKGGTRAERRLIIRRVLLAVIPGWLPHFERELEPESELAPVMTMRDIVPKREEIVAEPIRVAALPKMSVILKRALAAKRAAERALVRPAEYRESIARPARPVMFRRIVADAYGGRSRAA